MLTTAALVILAALVWAAFSLLAGILVGQLLRRGERPTPVVRRAPVRPRLVQPAA